MNKEKLPEFLIKMLEEQYGLEISKKIIEGYNAKRLTTFRVNTLKTDITSVENKLIEAGIEYKRVEWYKGAFIVKDELKNQIENMEIYEKGEIYLQSLSSMLPPIILEPKQGEDILDMAAAPGGKTTQIAAITENKANITACEMNNIRLERLKYNIEKQGAKCVYVMNTDSRKIDDFFSFDKILLDAPCSGSGTLDFDDVSLKNTFTMKLINKSIDSQLALLKKAINILKPGKEMVYSTCSILACENEEIVKKALVGTKVEIVPIEFEGMETLPLLQTKIKGTICVMPNEFYEGFFIAKIKKKC